MNEPAVRACAPLIVATWGAGGPPDETRPEPLWVFAYGSLMWEPNFVCAEVRPALLRGYHRALCILSIRNRGTETKPGLVLGLDRGGSCAGRALRVAPGHYATTLAYLEQREMSTAAYRPKLVPVRLDGGESVRALAFVAEPRHRQYVGTLAPEEAARLVRQGRGSYGASLDYLRNVIAHLDRIGIADGPLHRVLALAEVAGEASGGHAGDAARSAEP
ncbi:MAG: gamma-glutamylcyclotransferase [Rhodospirillales bacterium]|nr:gamma-glutamylcyclotransferase [Rhodospirillales bacterium]